MKLLLDTNAALFMWADRRRLSPTARTLLESTEHTVVFSQTSTWEICLKYRTGKLNLGEAPDAYLRKRLLLSDLSYEPIADEAIFRSIDLPPHHHDPFDRLLIATAQILEVPIVTSDEIFRRYAVEVLW